jgi:hypothetical protein
MGDPTPGNIWIDCPDWADMNIENSMTGPGGGASTAFDVDLELGTGMQLEHNLGFTGASLWPGTWNMDLLV